MQVTAGMAGMILFGDLLTVGIIGDGDIIRGVLLDMDITRVQW